MPKPNEKLAESLAALQDLQKGGRRVFRSRELSRTHRERLLRNGFLREVMKGWLMSSGPERARGRQHALVRVLLGILCRLLPGPIWRRVAPVARAVGSSACAEYRDSDPGGGLQPERARTTL